MSNKKLPPVMQEAVDVVVARQLHHPTLSPSILPKKAKCIHFTSGEVGSAADRGTALHKQISDFLIHKTPIEDDGARNACNRMRNVIQSIGGVEDKLFLFDGNFEEVTFGTADAWGYTENRELVLWDFKSGSQNPLSYREQMASYALMLMDREEVSTCTTYIGGIDSGEDYTETFTYEQAYELVFGVIERVQAGLEDPVENEFCGWCANKHTCPVYKAPAEKALALSPAALPAEFKFTKEWILASPQNSAIALDALDKLKDIFDDLAVRDRVKQAILGGEKIAGWKTQTKKGAVSLDSDKVRAMWKTLTDLPIPEKTGSPSTSLVRAKA